MSDQIPTPNANASLVYSTVWGPDYKRAKRFLGEHRVPYVNIDIEQDATGLRRHRRHADDFPARPIRRRRCAGRGDQTGRLRRGRRGDRRPGNLGVFEAGGGWSSA